MDTLRTVAATILIAAGGVGTLLGCLRVAMMAARRQTSLMPIATYATGLCLTVLFGGIALAAADTLAAIGAAGVFVTLAVANSVLGIERRLMKVREDGADPTK